MFDLPDGLLLQQLPLKYLGTVAAAPINHIIELIDDRIRHLTYRLGHRRELRLQVITQLAPVKSDHGDILRNPQSSLMYRPVHASRNRI